ncbi:MAG TPA: hypothetical protein VFG87_03590 [Amycolatopsis sp.]|nr:hypothetical protein [Amycolatopsis sp.]
MRRVLTRVLVSGAVAAAALALGGGVAGAAEPGTPIWLLPGVDVGSVADPTVGLPATVLAPVDAVLTYFG